MNKYDDDDNDEGDLMKYNIQNTKHNGQERKQEEQIFL